MSKLAHSSDDATMDAIERQGRALDEQESRGMAHPVSALALVETVTAVQVFGENGLDNILERIEKEARTTALDISTPKGRKDIASLAHKIAKSKTALDKMGKELVSGWKEKAKKVDQERARAWDRLEALQNEVRQPLTDWENRDKERIENHLMALAEIAQAGSNTAANWQTLPLDAMNDRLKELLSDKTDWQEFSLKAKLALEAAADAIAAAIIKRQKHDADQAELVRLRKEEEERKQREHEDRIKAEAAEKARKEAEEKARRAAESEARRVTAEKEAAEQDLQRIQREKDEAEARAAQAEKDRIVAEKKAKEDARIAAEKAAADKKIAEEAAAKRERDRIEADKQAEAAATARREADKAHRAKINRGVHAGLMAAINTAISPDHQAAAIIEAITKGQIPHVRIQY